MSTFYLIATTILFGCHFIQITESAYCFYYPYGSGGSIEVKVETYCANFCCPSKSETPNGACCYTNYAWWITFPILFVCCALAAFTVVLYAIIKRSRMRRMQRQQRMRQQQRQQQSINNNGFNGQPISFKPDHPRISSSSPQNQIMSSNPSIYSFQSSNYQMQIDPSATTQLSSPPNYYYINQTAMPTPLSSSLTNQNLTQPQQLPPPPIYMIESQKSFI